METVKIVMFILSSSAAVVVLGYGIFNLVYEYFLKSKMMELEVLSHNILMPKSIMPEVVFKSDNLKIIVMQLSTGKLVETTVYHARNFLSPNEYSYIGLV